ncbi:PolC-type DNA polymerase III [Thermodesulfovibrio thiophilus]|uniref:3'-5' exonuclease n=1 Tax=Thermodesulfovibrio thiophilus TaxID=340095 RepID=UPI0004061976|nr:3'-5' exonuclease [Thermodesulfovibrio thiophilus]
MFSIFKKQKINKFKGLSINETEFVVVDTELTGLHETKDTIISVGCIKMKGKTIKMGEIFYRTVKPESFLKKDSIMIHEITPTELESCPDIKPVLREYLSFVKDLIVVGFCVSIDIVFLKKAINKHINQIYEPIALDTFVIYRWLIQKGLLPEKFIQNNSLQSVALSLGVEPKELHDALADAFITAQIFQRLISFLSELNIYTVQEMLNIGSPDISGYMGIAKKEVYQF